MGSSYVVLRGTNMDVTLDEMSGEFDLTVDVRIDAKDVALAYNDNDGLMQSTIKVGDATKLVEMSDKLLEVASYYGIATDTTLLSGIVLGSILTEYANNGFVSLANIGLDRAERKQWKVHNVEAYHKAVKRVAHSFNINTNIPHLADKVLELMNGTASLMLFEKWTTMKLCS